MALLAWVGLGIIVLVLLIIAGIYNSFISKRNRVQDALAQIDVQLKRRYDLIPNLIETVKGYAKYEKGVLTQVTQLRSSIMTGSVDHKLKANDQLSRALKSIFAVAENYPDLKASQNFKDLQEQLEGTEDKISYVRTSFNDYVLDYNNSLQTVPRQRLRQLVRIQAGHLLPGPSGAERARQGGLQRPERPNAPAAPKGKAKKQKG